jgi:glycosyltransferase involved in cell wall biosynthesis
VSDFTKKRLQSILAVRENVPVIWNGIDPAEYHNLPNVIHEDGKILFFGRFAPHKGIELLIKAFKIVKNIRPEASLHIVGDGPLKRQVIAMASRLEDIHVHIAVPRTKLLEIIKSAWVTVIPSHREGHGISYLESMAAGTPVITIKSPYNAFSNIVKNGEEALVTNPEPSSLAKAILTLLQDEELRSRLSENGKIFVSKFCWENISLKLEKVLENSLDENR